MFTLDPAIQVRDELRAAGIRADLDPDTLALPGVWVQVTGLRFDTYATTAVDMTLGLIVGDQNATRAAGRLVQLLNDVATALGGVRTATARTFLMPDGTRLPGLAVPYVHTAPYSESE